MSLSLLYHWADILRQQFASLSKPQTFLLAAFSAAAAAAEHCQLRRLAEHLCCLGSPSTVERRLQRWLASAAWDVVSAQQELARWVIGRLCKGCKRLVCPSDVGGVSVSGLEERLFSVAEQSCVGAVSCAAFMVRSGSRLFYDDMVRQLGGSSSGMDAWGRYCFSLECVQAGFTGIPLEFRQRLWGAFDVGLQGEFVFVDG
jgi:hypothetical protein